MVKASNLFVVAFIADIHFGSMKSNLLYEQLQKRFLKKLKKKRIDMVVIGGDLFHNIITMNYSTSHIVLMFMKDLIETCIKNGIRYIRVIQGTMSHDNNQLHNFHMFENRTDIDFKIIMTVQTETLAEGIDILYLPEEYMNNPQEYYEEYLDVRKKYDFVFGHGMVEEVAFVAKKQESENTMSRAPIFNTKQLLGTCKGPIYFGHIHIRTTVKKHFHYPGSFSRFKHGEEDDKGFYICAYSPISHKYVHEFIVNDLAPIYTAITVTVKDHYREHPEDIVEFVKNISADYIKINLIIETDCSYAIQYLTNTYRECSNIKIDVKNVAQLKREIEEEELHDKIMEKYDFVFDKGLSTYETIQKFIKVKHGKDISLDTIKDELGVR